MLRAYISTYLAQAMVMIENVLGPRWDYMFHSLDSISHLSNFVSMDMSREFHMLYTL
jgi:hypothetical protein